MSKIKTPIERFPEFVKLINKSVDENGVRNAYRILMGIKDWEAPFNCDGYYSSVLYEFKYDKKLNSKEGYKALAQACYYLRKFVVEGRTFPDKKGQLTLWNPPIKVVVADKNEAFIVMSKELESFYMSDDYDWARSACSPDERLVKDISVVKYVIFNTTDKAYLQAYLDALNAQGTAILKIINRNNFDSIFQIWREEFAPNLDPQRAALAFILDLENRGLANLDTGVVLFDFEGKTQNVKLRVPVNVYKKFWSSYKRPPCAKELSAIYERKDRLVAMQNRRMDGEFFTPLSYAELAHKYLMDAIPDSYNGTGNHHSIYDDYNWYDPCCGSGNLTYHCPAEMKGKLFMSTLNQEDVDVCVGSGQNPNAQIFAYDFLNQTDEELPKELKDRLTPGSKWVFIFNPPFFVGSDLLGVSSNKGESRKSNTSTLVSKNVMGQARRNLYAQFLYRIQKMIRDYNIQAHIGIFSTSSYINSDGYKSFRTEFNKTLNFNTGFVFPCDVFQGTKGKWPIIFAVWGTHENNDKSENDYILDVYDNNVAKIGQKTYYQVFSPLSKWISKRPVCDTIAPVVNGAISVLDIKKRIYTDKIAKHAIGYALSVSNDVHNGTQFTLIASTVFNNNGNGWSIVPSNFDKTITMIGIRRLVSVNWINWQDQFSIPNIEHQDYEQFKNDLIIWSLFDAKNQSSSLGDIEYKDNIYDIKNEFFFLTKDEIEKIDTMPSSTLNQANRSNERYVSGWLKDKTFSPDIQELLELGKELVKVSAWARPHADPKFQLMRWDAGWYQIRMGLFGKDVKFTKTPEMIEAMEKFTEKYKEITTRLRPYVYELGFLPKEIIFEEENI